MWHFRYIIFEISKFYIMTIDLISHIDMDIVDCLLIFNIDKYYWYLIWILLILIFNIDILDVFNIDIDFSISIFKILYRYLLICATSDILLWSPCHLCDCRYHLITCVTSDILLSQMSVCSVELCAFNFYTVFM